MELCCGYDSKVTEAETEEVNSLNAVLHRM
jgi:hypothetical protein